MSLTPEQIAELERKAKLADELQSRIDSLAGNKDSILDEKKKLQKELDDLKAADTARKQKEMEDKGQLQGLLDQARARITELEKALADKEKEIGEVKIESEKQSARSDFLAAISSSAFSPKQLWTLFKNGAKRVDGKTVVVYKGQEVLASEIEAKLRQDPEFAYHFKPAGSSGGMGATGSGGATGQGAEFTGGNPWLPGGNVTQRIALQTQNPELAAKLKAQAAAAK